MIAQWDFDAQRKSVVFVGLDDACWHMEIIGVRAIDGSGNHLLIYGYIGTLRNGDTINYDGGAVIEIDYYTSKHKGILTINR